MIDFRTLLGVVALGGMTATAATPASAQIDTFFTADLTGEESVRRAVPGTPGVSLTTQPLDRPTDVEVVGDTLFFTDTDLDRIYSLPTIGGVRSEVVDLSTIGDNVLVTGFAVSSDGSDFYFGELFSNAIYRASGGTIEEIVPLVDTFAESNFNPRGAALDEANGKFYWSDSITDKVYRSNLDGSGAEELFTTNTPDNTNTSPNAVALDLDAGRIYVADNDDFIATADLDGSNIGFFSLDDSGFLDGQDSYAPEDIEFFSGRVYVADTTNGVFSYDPATGGSFQSLSTDVNTRGVAVVPEPATAALLGLGALALATRRRTAG